MPSIDVPPSFQRDSVRLVGLRTRADLNDCYGLVQSKLAKDRYEVRIGGESLSVKLANMQFLGPDFPNVVFDLEGLAPNMLGVHAGDDDMRKQGHVLDKFMRVKYMGDVTPVPQSDPLLERMQATLEKEMREKSSTLEATLAQA